MALAAALASVISLPASTATGKIRFRVPVSGPPACACVHTARLRLAQIASMVGVLVVVCGGDVDCAEMVNGDVLMFDVPCEA